MIENDIPLLEDILGKHKGKIGNDFPGYRNHVYRVIHFCLAQRSLDDEEREKVIIAGCFHDLGIWVEGTFDYLPPSIALAGEYLRQSGLERWMPEVELMIGQHHRLRKYPGGGYPLVEVFRRGDLVDFSLGIVKCGIPDAYVGAVKARFPNEGFHKQLLRLAAGWICRHPLNPVPVLKW